MLLRMIAVSEDMIVWAGTPPLASVAVLGVGLLVRPQSRRAGQALVVVGAVGVLASAGWVTLLLYIDSVVR